MSEGYVVAVEGLSALRDLQSIPAEIKRAALQAVNKTADRARTRSARMIREQVAFPARYLSPGQNGRLRVSKRAKADDLEAVITGRQRPTSLATFRRGGAVGSRRGVRVEVAPGFARLMRRAFLVRLRSGATELGNLGLAIRLPEGKTPDRAYKPTRLGNNVWLLYGPAVDQVFRSVAQDVSPEASVFLETEFLRLLELDN